MVAGCGASCVKYLFFVFNFLVFVCGGAILGISLWAIFDKNFGSEIKDITNINKDGTTIDVQNVMIPLYILAAVGGFLLICGFLGCCGACCENTCLLGLFFFVILLLFLAEIAGGIYIFVEKDDMQKDIRTSFEKNVVKNKDEKVQDALKNLQTTYHCCGANGCKGNVANVFGDQVKGDGGVLDTVNKVVDAGATFVVDNLSSCCRAQTTTTTPGCTDKVIDTLKNNITIVAIVAVSLVVIELLAMIFSCILCNAIRNSASAYY